MKNPSETVVVNGISALDLIGEKLSTVSFAKSKAVLQASYGTQISTEKFALLFDLISDEGWSEERFNQTLKWFIKNKPYASWTIADWFSFPTMRIYPLQWYQNETMNGAKPESFDVYVLPDGEKGYRYKDGQVLPFPKAEKTEPLKPLFECRDCGLLHIEKHCPNCARLTGNN